ncbi:MAG: hypothetical protein WBQ50_01540 [Nocardioides sp.]
MRATFHERDDAEAVRSRLLRDGFDASLGRDRFAGEDDDEDHAWAVHSDAPAIVLELLAEEHDGWVDHEQESPAPAPLALPDGPIRREP